MLILYDDVSSVVLGAVDRGLYFAAVGSNFPTGRVIGVQITLDNEMEGGDRRLCMSRVLFRSIGFVDASAICQI